MGGKDEVGEVHKMIAVPHIMTTVRVKARIKISSPSPSHAPIMPPIMPAQNHRGKRGIARRGTRATSVAPTRTVAVMIRENQVGTNRRVVDRAAQQRILVPNHMRVRPLSQGKGRGIVGEEGRWGRALWQVVSFLAVLFVVALAVPG